MLLITILFTLLFPIYMCDADYNISKLVNCNMPLTQYRLGGRGEEDWVTGGKASTVV